MNDTINYSFSFSYNQPATPTEPELIMFDDCRVYQLPDDHVLIRSKQSGIQTLVTNDVLYSLHKCDSFKTLDQHISHLAATIPELQGQETDIRQILTSVQQAGLMVSARALATELSHGSPAVQADLPLSLCILSCDRPRALKRLLGSMLSNYGINPGYAYHVIDDSRQKDSQLRNRALVEAFNQEHGTRINYFGLEEQAWFQQQLESSLPGHSAAINFLIGRYQNEGTASYGRTRNLALLLSVGRRLILLDDDIVYHKHLAPKVEAGARISPVPRDADFYADNREWEGFASDDPADPASEFNALLGCTLEQALAILKLERLPQERLAELTPLDLQAVQKDARIMVAGCGTFGDPGIASNDWLYEINPTARKSLLRSETFYQEARSRRNVWSGRHALHFSPRFVLLSQMTGLDNRELLPPYFPLFRNEDFLFGENLQFLHPKSLMVDFPWALPHLPLEDRRWDKDSISRPIHYGVLAFTADYLAPVRSDYQSTDPSVRLQALGRHYFDLGALDDVNLGQLLRDETCGLQCARIQRLDKILREYPDAPGYWADDVRKAIAANQKDLMTPLDELFPHCLKDTPRDKRLQHARELWQQFGQSLVAWEAIRQAAQQISQNGAQSE